MKKVLKYITYSLVLILVSCNDDDIQTEIPPFKLKFSFFLQNFTGVATSSGTNEIPIALDNWKNYNTLNTRKWICKESSGNRYAEFSSFFSAANTSDETWMVLTNQDFTKSVSENLGFRVATNFANGATLKLLISTNYDGTQAGLATANWIEKPLNIPLTTNISFTEKIIDLSEFESTNVSIAFKYEGSKQTGKTTTFQIDDISLFEIK